MATDFVEPHSRGCVGNLHLPFFSQSTRYQGIREREDDFQMTIFSDFQSASLIDRYNRFE